MEPAIATHELHWLAGLLEGVKAVASHHRVSVWCIYDLRLGRTFRHLARPG